MPSAPNKKQIYHSFQQNFTIGPNGVPHGTATVVDIENGKGTKSKLIYTSDKKPRRSTKKLTKSEIQKITRNVFIPRLFSPSNASSPIRNRGKSRRLRK